MSVPLLAFEHTDVSYGGFLAVRDVCATLGAGRILGVVGESGSGKSTLIRAAMGLLGSAGAVTRGDILYEGRSLVDMPARELRALCGSELGMVFQDCLAALTPTRTIASQVREMARAHGHSSDAGTLGRARDLLGRMNVADPARILGSYPFELSGGLGQRVGIAMAMLMRPKLLFADEPTSALDVVSQKQVVGELARVRSELGCAIVVVTHNIAVVRMLADDVLVLRGGHVVEQGPADQLLSHPRQPYTVELLDAAPRLHKESCP